MNRTIDKYHIQITMSMAIIVIIAIISTTFAYATMKAESNYKIDYIDERQTHLADKYVKINDRIIELESTDTDFKIQMAELNIKLANIETLLIEIKQDIKENK